ncbi:MAG: PQQ-binding-like beta-propeller repeat protein [Planctomycetota bacterium]
MIRPKEFVWAYPEEPPYNVDAKPMKNAPAVDSEGRILFCTQGRLVALEDQGEGPPRIVWEYVTGSHVPGPVVVAPDGNILLHLADGFLHCVSPVGKQVWAPAHVGEALGWAAPVCDARGNTYVSDYDGGLIRVDAKGKKAQRPYFRSRRKFDSAGVIHNGVLYIGAEDGYVFAIELGPERGKNVWDHAAEQGYTGGYLNSSPAVTGDGVLVVAARDETLFGFASSGAAVWAAKMPGMMLASPVIDPHGHIYVGVTQAQRGQEPRGLLACVDGNSHKIRWQYQAAGPVESTPVVGDDETVYFGDDSGTIHAVDTRGNAKWTAKVEAAVRSAGAILAPERLAFGLDDDTLVVLRCSSQALAPGGWPKIACTLSQTGMAPSTTATYGEVAVGTVGTGDEESEQAEADAAQTEDGQKPDDQADDEHSEP